MSTQGGQFSTRLKVQNIKTPQGGPCLHKVHYSTEWTVPRKVDCVYTRRTVSTQGGQIDRWTGRPCLHKVDCVYTRWTVSTQGGQVSTRLNVQYINTKESRGPYFHQVDVSLQVGLFFKMWTVSSRGGLCLHRAETPFSAVESYVYNTTWKLQEIKTLPPFQSSTLTPFS